MNVFKYYRQTYHLPRDAQQAKITPDRNNANRFRITGWARDIHIQEPTIQQQEDTKMSWMIKNTYSQQDER